jgi:hypothetical protein
MRRALTSHLWIVERTLRIGFGLKGSACLDVKVPEHLEPRESLLGSEPHPLGLLGPVVIQRVSHLS